MSALVEPALDYKHIFPPFWHPHKILTLGPSLIPISPFMDAPLGEWKYKVKVISSWFFKWSTIEMWKLFQHPTWQLTTLRLILKIQIYEGKVIHVKFNGVVIIIPKDQLKTATWKSRALFLWALQYVWLLCLRFHQVL